MLYTGRAALVSLSVGVSLSEWALGLDKELTELAMDVAFTFLAWVVGGLYDKAAFLSTHDELTEVYNRRYIRRKVPAWLRRASTTRTPLCVFVLDLNDFKVINDTYGHEAGDRALHLFASGLRYFFKRAGRGSKALVSRWGGDEFLVVLWGADENDARSISDALHRFFQDDYRPFLKETERFEVALGYAVFPKEGDSFDALLARADARMYRCKSLSKRSAEPPRSFQEIPPTDRHS